MQQPPVKMATSQLDCQEQTWQRINKTDSLFANTTSLAEHVMSSLSLDPANSARSVSSMGSATYSLSDISLSSSSCSEKDSGVEETENMSLQTQTNVTTNFLFLPPTVSNDDHTSVDELSLRRKCYPPFVLHNHDFVSVVTPDNISFSGSESHSESTAIFEPVASRSSESMFEFDLVSMRDKLESQKECLQGAFQKQQSLPQALATNYRYSHAEKPTSLKMKDKLNKFGRSARQFWNSKILRRSCVTQRCEIQLQGFSDVVERLILVISQRSSGKEALQVYMPSFFETDRVSLPTALLPTTPAEMMTVSVYGVTVPSNKQLPVFSEVLISGVCTVHMTGAARMVGKVELQPHRPCRSMLSHNKAVQSCGSSVATTHTCPDQYTFSTLPKPIARDFTELCILQTAQPFREFLAMASSTCDQSAAFNTRLSPGEYHVVCSYRLTHSPLAGAFPLASATQSVFFRAYTDKAEVGKKLTAASELTTQNRESLFLPSLSLCKPRGFRLDVFMKTLHAKPDTISVNSSQLPPPIGLGTTDEGLYICAWDVGKHQPHKTDNATSDSWSAQVNGNARQCHSVSINPRLSTGSKDIVLLPSLSLFNMNTRLFFADHWSYYDTQYVTLVLCKKGSACQKVCKEVYTKLDPYNNPFLFRKRCFDPEPSVAVHASANINVEVIYSESKSIQKLVSVCSENVYFCKVQVLDR